MSSIPTRFIGTGNVARAKTLIGTGRKHLNKLRHDMGFQSLPTGRSTVRFPDGTVIECFANHGLSEVRIHVPGGERMHVEQERTCFCFPHFSFGVVVSATGEPDRTTRMTYDVELCAGGRKYVFIEGIIDPNFGRYYPGQYVFVTVGAEMEGWENPLDCQRSCLIDEPLFDVMAIAPVHIPGRMRKWQFEEIVRRR